MLLAWFPYAMPHEPALIVYVAMTLLLQAVRHGMRPGLLGSDHPACGFDVLTQATMTAATHGGDSLPHPCTLLEQVPLPTSYKKMYRKHSSVE
ncbi:hypothetical protein E2C01_004367 [Portunus trituberculatus]|uniref:Uncharacterized protein n=1 Tax=Portunus trituberculatus TaxID=210409 RepID=A0A5B7CR73_PORTR|nr:hypothetical protein [Portunus trituberculatus]